MVLRGCLIVMNHRNIDIITLKGSYMAGTRPRIIKMELEGNIVEDTLAFVKNKCTERARKIITLHEELKYELWYDQHYIITRHQHGEDNGERRLGINPEQVEGLITKAINHMLYYSARVKGFSFLNHESESLVRIVLQDSTEGNTGTLNVVIEVHLLDSKTFEVTVKTALRKCDYRLESGQYAIEFFEGNSSLLKKYEHSNAAGVEVLSFEI